MFYERSILKSREKIRVRWISRGKIHAAKVSDSIESKLSPSLRVAKMCRPSTAIGSFLYRVIYRNSISHTCPVAGKIVSREIKLKHFRQQARQIKKKTIGRILWAFASRSVTIFQITRARSCAFTRTVCCRRTEIRACARARTCVCVRV